MCRSPASPSPSLLKRGSSERQPRNAARPQGRRATMRVHFGVYAAATRQFDQAVCPEGPEARGRRHTRPKHTCLGTTSRRKFYPVLAHFHRLPRRPHAQTPRLFVRVERGIEPGAGSSCIVEKPVRKNRFVVRRASKVSIFGLFWGPV